jgi:hypothetical protein
VGILQILSHMSVWQVQDQVKVTPDCMYTIVENQGEKLGCTGSRAAEEPNDGLTSPGQHNHHVHGSTGASGILMTNTAGIMMVLVSSFVLAFGNAGP